MTDYPNTLKAAQRLLNAGFSIIPCKADKAPSCATWQPFQTTPPTQSQFSRLFSNKTKNIGLVYGVNDVYCIDIDQKYALDGCLLSRFGGGVNDKDSALIDKLVIQETPSGGYHIIFKCVDLPKDLAQLSKLAQRPATPEEGATGVKDYFDFFRHGKYALIAPSTGYKLLQGDLFNMEAITPEEARLLIETAQSFDEVDRSPETDPNRPTFTGKQYGSKNSDRSKLTNTTNYSPFVQFNGEYDVLALLSRHGWKIGNISKKNTVTVQRSGKAKGSMSGNFDNKSRFLTIYSPSTNFQTGKQYSAFDVFRIFEHNGNKKAAAKEVLKKYSKEIEKAKETPAPAVIKAAAPAAKEPPTPPKKDAIIIDKYISENLAPIHDKIIKKESFALDSVPNSGKTFSLYKKIIPAHPEKLFINGFPTNLANQSAFNTYADDLKIVSIDQDTEPEIKRNLDQILPDLQAVNFCYPSYGHVKEAINKDTVLFCDEPHKWITNGAITDLDIINDIIESEATKIYCTGTHFESFIQEYNLPRIAYEKTQKANINFKCIEIEHKSYKLKKKLKQIEKAQTKLADLQTQLAAADSASKMQKIDKDIQQKQKQLQRFNKELEKIRSKNSHNVNQAIKVYKLAAQNIINNIDTSGPEKVHFIFLNHKRNINSIAENKEAYLELIQQVQQLQQDTNLNDFDIDVLYSDNDIKEGELWQYLTGAIKDNEGQPLPIPTNGKHRIIICTSIAYETINVYNTNIGVYAFLGEGWVENILQGIKRPRFADGLDVMWMLAKGSNENPFVTTYANYRKNYYSKFKEAKKLAEQLAEQNPLLGWITPDKDRPKLIADATKTMTSKGKFNRLKCVVEYENIKTRKETNLQKFGRIEQLFDTDILELDVSDIYQLFPASEKDSAAAQKIAELTAEKEATANELADTENIETTEKIQGLMLKNAHYLLAFLLDSNIKLSLANRQQITELLLKTDFDYKDPLYLSYCNNISLNHYQSKRLKFYCLKLLELLQYAQLSTELILYVFDKNEKHLLEQLKTAAASSSNDTAIISNTDIEIRKQIVQVVEEAAQSQENREFTLPQLRELIDSIYHKYSLEISDSKKHQLIKGLYLHYKKRTKKQIILRLNRPTLARSAADTQKLKKAISTFYNISVQLSHTNSVTV